MNGLSYSAGEELGRILGAFGFILWIFRMYPVSSAHVLDLSVSSFAVPVWSVASRFRRVGSSANGFKGPKTRIQTESSVQFILGQLQRCQSRCFVKLN